MASKDPFAAIVSAHAALLVNDVRLHKRTPVVRPVRAARQDVLAPATFSLDIVLKELLARRKNGESYSALARDLNLRGFRGPRGARIYAASIRLSLNQLGEATQQGADTE